VCSEETFVMALHLFHDSGEIQVKIVKARLYNMDPDTPLSVT